MKNKAQIWNKQRLEAYFAGLVAAGRKLPKTPMKKRGRVHSVYQTAIAIETGIPLVSLGKSPLREMLVDAERRIGFHDPGTDVEKLAGEWLYVPDAMHVLGCSLSVLQRAVRAGSLEQRKCGASSQIRIPDLSGVETMGKLTTLQRARVAAFNRAWAVPEGGIRDGAWIEEYNRARGYLRMARSVIIPEPVVLAACDYLWNVEATLPTAANLSALFYGQRGEYVRRREERFLETAKAWRDRQPDFVPLVDEAVTVESLARILSPGLLPIPFTCFDRDAPEEAPPPRPSILNWLGRIRDQDLRDMLTLLAAIQAANHRAQHSVESYLRSFHARILEVRSEAPGFDPLAPRVDDVLRRVWEGELCASMSTYTRHRFPLHWNNAARIYELYAMRLGEADRERLFAFAPKVLQDQYYWRNLKPKKLLLYDQQRRRKQKVDAIAESFYELRFDAEVRFNLCARLRDHCRTAVAKARSGEVTLPYDFGYEEQTALAGRRRGVRQIVRLRLHSYGSLLARLRATGAVAPAEGKEAASGGEEEYFVEYLRTDAVRPEATAQPLWFLEILENKLHAKIVTEAEQAERARIFAAHGYTLNDAMRLPSGMLNYAPNRWRNERNVSWLLTRARAELGTLFLPFEEIYAAALYARALFRTQSITGARIGEILQLKATRGAFREETIPLPNGRSKTIYSFRAIPKGHTEEADYFLDRETVEQLVAVAQYARESAGLTDPKAPLPVVPGYLEAKVPPDRYVFQIRRRPINTVAANALIRFLFWGILKGLESHSIRHAVANQLDRLGVEHEVIAKLLKQKDLATTAYYKEPTRSQVVRASELLFVDAIDWDVRPEGIRKKTASEHAKFLRELEAGREVAGPLTEVAGGVCTVMKFCAAQFSCINCAGKVPDPAKRLHVITKRAEAERRLEWSVAEGLLQEERQARAAMADCDAELEEMDLIEAARADAEQSSVYVDREDLP